LEVGKGQKIGVIGLGGLGHMGVKLAKALGQVVMSLPAGQGKDHAARRR